MLSTIFDPQKKEVTEGLTEVHSEKRHSLYVSLCPIIIKSLVMRWDRHGARARGKNIPVSMRDIYTKYDTFKSQAYKEHCIKIQLGKMGYVITNQFPMARNVVRWQRWQ